MLHASRLTSSPPSLPASRRIETHHSLPRYLELAAQIAINTAIAKILENTRGEKMHADPGIEGTMEHSTPPAWDGGGMIITESHEEPRDYNPDADPTAGSNDNAFS